MSADFRAEDFMPKIYIYKVTVDNGGAPCVCQGCLTLAICKPRIRCNADEKAIVMGFAGNDARGWHVAGPYRDNRLVYLAEVTRAIPAGEYYSDPQYGARPDCIYEWRGNTLRHRKDAKFHEKPADHKRDVGEKQNGYKNARVLLSTHFRYFASKGPSPHQQGFDHLSELISKLTQGHRVNHTEELLAEINEFVANAWCHKPKIDETPIPKLRSKRSCDQDDSCFTCER
jgi:hypothetical protein